MSTETATAEKVDLVQMEFEARWDLTVPLSEFGDLSPEDDIELEEWVHENTDKVLNALDLSLIQGNEPIEIGFGGAHMYQGVAPALTEWPTRDPKDSAPYFEPVPSFVSRFNFDTGKEAEESPVTEWSDDKVVGAIHALQFTLGYCSIGERQKSNLMPFVYELLHALYARPTIHNFVQGDTEGSCVYCTQPQVAHTSSEDE